MDSTKEERKIGIKEERKQELNIDRIGLASSINRERREETKEERKERRR